MPLSDGMRCRNCGEREVNSIRGCESDAALVAGGHEFERIRPDRPGIVLLLGQARSGKDTAGAWIADEAGGTTLAFADKLKEICMEMFGLSREDCYTDEGKRRETAFVHHSRPLTPIRWTVREILQHMGTEAFRHVDPNVWVRYALSAAQESLQKYRAGVVVITDGRFKSEVAGVRAVGGEVWRIRRPGADGVIGLANHQSEIEQQEIPDSECDVVIENDATLEVFRKRVLEAVAAWRGRRTIDDPDAGWRAIVGPTE